MENNSTVTISLTRYDELLQAEILLKTATRLLQKEAKFLIDTTLRELLDIREEGGGETEEA